MSGLSSPRTSYGIHSVTPYSRVDGTPYGILKVLKDSSISLAGDLIELSGGSNKYPWQIETGKITADMSLKFHDYPDFVFTLFFGATPSSNSMEASGNIGTLTNVNGTSVMSSTTGIASVVLTSGAKANLKFGRYVIVAVSSTTVDVYCYTDVDFGRGATGVYTGDALKIAAAVTITASTASSIANFGLDLSGGSGTIGMTIGDSAQFDVRPVNTGNSSVTVGSPNNVVPEWGALIVAQKQGQGALFEIDAFRVKASGIPFGFAEKAFSEIDVKAKLLYDSAKDGVYKMTTINAS